VGERLSVGLEEVFAGSARWTAAAAPFAAVAPPVVTGTSPSAVAVGAIHADVTASHAAFGARLVDTASHTQLAGVGYSVQDVQTSVDAINQAIGGAVQ
jgi:hypothetical protein